MADRHLAPKYDPKIALKMLEGISEGKTVSELVKTEGYPSRATWYRWLALYPDLKAALDTARELSAQTFEDEMLDIARMLKAKNDFTAVRTTQLQTVLQQLRWSASRRDPSRYGQKQTPDTAVAIQINTSLDLGQGSNSAPGHADVYTLEAVVPGTLTPGDEEPPDGDLEQAEDSEGSGVEPLTQTDNPFALPAAPARRKLGAVLGLDQSKLVPEARKTPHAKRHPKHKTPTQIRATKAAHAGRDQRRARKSKEEPSE